MTDNEFMKLIDAGVAQLSPRVLERLDNVAIVMADAPSEEQRAAMDLHSHETLFGLYEGVPQIDRGLVEEPLLPDKITIFKSSILDAYTDPADIAVCVANTIWHEVAHHFGMDEDQVTHEEVVRGKQL